MSRSIEISQITIPIDKVAQMSACQRYTYYILGHVFNEMMSLQKLVGFAIPKHEDMRPCRRNAEIAQLLLLFRLAASKIYEFRATVNSKEVKSALTDLVFSEAPHLRDELTQFNRAVSGAAWLERMRNGMGFHYPKFQQWEQYTTPDQTWVDDIVYIGEQSGNTFYDASASVAMHWMFDNYRDLATADSFGPLVSELIRLIKQINRLIEAMVGTMVMAIAPNDPAKPVGKILGPDHDKVTLPFWTHLAHIRHRKG